MKKKVSPSSSFVLCSACHRHRRREEASCPHCGSTSSSLPSDESGRFAQRLMQAKGSRSTLLAASLFGISTIFGCPPTVPPTEKASEKAAEISKEISKESASESSQEAAAEGVKEASQELPKEAPQETAHEAPQETAHEAPQETAQEAPQEALKEATPEPIKDPIIQPPYGIPPTDGGPDSP